MIYNTDLNLHWRSR